MNFMEVEFEGKTERVWVEKRKGDLWLHLKGEVHVWSPIQQVRNSTSASSAQGARVVRAPMPGKILRIFAEEGAKVSIGDKVLAMEAMKMEYTLEAQQSGQLRFTNCKVGDQVSLGQELAHISPEIPSESK